MQYFKRSTMYFVLKYPLKCSEVCFEVQRSAYFAALGLHCRRTWETGIDGHFWNSLQYEAQTGSAQMGKMVERKKLAMEQQDWQLFRELYWYVRTCRYDIFADTPILVIADMSIFSYERISYTDNNALSPIADIQISALKMHANSCYADIEKGCRYADIIADANINIGTSLLYSHLLLSYVCLLLTLMPANQKEVVKLPWNIEIYNFYIC